MQSHLKIEHMIDVTLPTIRSHLLRTKTTLKLVRDVTINCDSLTTRQKRLHYAHNLLDGTVNILKWVFIDESGFNGNIRRSFGRSYKGTRCFKQCQAQRGKNLSLYMTISVNGVIHHKLKSGSFDRSAFQEFLTELSIIIGDEEVYFIMDNCRIHYETFAEYDRHKIVFLPPYSPMLNPIESIFSVLKSNVKSENAKANIIKSAQSHTALKKSIEDWIFSNMSVDMTRYFRHCQEYNHRCIKKIY